MKNSISSYVRWRLFRASKSQLRAKSFEDALIIGLEYDVFVLRGCFPEDTESDTFDANPKNFSMLFGRILHHRISPRSYFLCKSRKMKKFFVSELQ